MNYIRSVSTQLTDNETSSSSVAPRRGHRVEPVVENNPEDNSPVVDTATTANTTDANQRDVNASSSSFSSAVVEDATTTATNTNNNIAAQPPPQNPEAVEIPCEQTEQEDEDDYDEDDDYEYEDDDDAHISSGFLMPSETAPVAAAAAPSTTASASANANAGVASSAPATIEEDGDDVPPAAAAAAAATKWREPTRQAVTMSLRAEKETTGGKRRLAQDLYRIMNQDTQDRGFSLEPKNEDDMACWTIHLFQFDSDSNLAKDMLVCNCPHVALEMTFPDQYPFEPPFVRVVQPRFKKQTGFVMNGALCMELLTKDGWNPINDIESVIVSIRSLLVVGDGRLEAACNLPEKKYNSLLLAAQQEQEQLQQQASAAASAAEAAGEGGLSSGDDDDDDDTKDPSPKRQRKNSAGDSVAVGGVAAAAVAMAAAIPSNKKKNGGGSYSVGEAKSAYQHLSDYHKKKGWDSSGWWARKG